MYYYRFDLERIDDLYPSQVDMFIENIPRLEYRAAYPVAAAMAHAANIAGGKPRRKPKPDYSSTPYRPKEFLAWFARFDPYLELAGFAGDETLGIDEETAKLVVTLNTTLEDGSRGSRLEGWMIAAFGDVWQEVCKAAGVS